MENAETGPPQTRVFVVDDDELFRESIEQNLVDAGFSVTGFPTGLKMLDVLTEGGSADLILLDWKMPEMNGIEVLKRLRVRQIEIPVIFLTVLNDQIYEEAALLGGAVDFVEKSRSFSILLKRIQLIFEGAKMKAAVPNAATPRTDDKAIFGSLVLWLESSRAFWKDRQVDLTLTEFKMVHYLATRAGKDVRYREIYDLVHGEGFVTGYGDEGYRTNVRTFIKRIRQKFREIDDTFEAIENYPGFGYRWRIDSSRDA